MVSESINIVGEIEVKAFIFLLFLSTNSFARNFELKKDIVNSNPGSKFEVEISLYKNGSKNKATKVCVLNFTDFSGQLNVLPKGDYKIIDDEITKPRPLFDLLLGSNGDKEVWSRYLEIDTSKVSNDASMYLDCNSQDGYNLMVNPFSFHKINKYLSPLATISK